MLTNELDYHLPSDLIAQIPVEPRDSSRLLVVNRSEQSITHHIFNELPELLHANDLLVANDSRVIPARVYGQKPTGGKVELLLLRKLDELTWCGLVGGRNVTDIHLAIPNGRKLHATVELTEDDSDWLIHFDQPIEPYLGDIGAMPLPPYIHESLDDPARYQTIYARISGSAAAPTAGLHFTPRLIESLSKHGIDMAFVTLHVGLDTFKPISEAYVEEHRIHSEWCELPNGTSESIRQTQISGGRIIAVGTTSARVLESAAGAGQDGTLLLKPYTGFTQLYITPGYHFALVDAIITNFHLPKSTLLAMIGAFMGLDLMRKAYDEAIRERYRFYSFGDVMLIL
jgi:S-adenosylmethionine:tRNA ribosyltransferase-isomerase